MDYVYLKLWILWLLVHLACCSSRECCRHISNRAKYSPCKDACEQAWMSSGPLQQIEIFSSAYRYCPTEPLVNFWQCIRDNYPVLADIELWEGRACCELAYSSECQLACQNAVTVSDLGNSCSQQDETPFYSCIRRQAGNVACCRNVHSDQCKAACHAMFVSESSPSETLQDNLVATCTSSDSYVPQCVGNRTQQHVETTLPEKSLQCCDKSSVRVCKQTCIQAFTSLTSQEDIIETLIPVCGQPISTEPMWQCFLLSQAPSNRGRAHAQQQLSPMDGASLQCCSRASSSQCRNLCIELYNRRLSSVWESFSASCQYNNQELAMMECIQEVEEPCEVGCDNLDFCSNFNGRDYNMFRSCNRKGDLAASKEYRSWVKEKSIQLPGLISVPIKDVESCEPELWKAISCSLNIKPCNQRGNSNRICKSDCTYILKKCVDNTKAFYDIGALCDQLSVSDDPDECISLFQFTTPSEDTAVDLSNPCVPNPCNSTEICEVNRKYPTCKKTHNSCHAHVCRSGCPAGDTSPLLIKSNYHVKMLDTESLRPLDCYKVCKCGHNGFLAHCQETYCENTDSCVVSSNVIVEHGINFKDQCNRCVCYSSELVCSVKHCSSQSNDVISTGLPCSCKYIYEPVCTNNGQVFSNPCLAQCAGYHESSYNAGNCASRNPCGVNKCAHGSKCVPERKVCLSSVTTCPQHRCVPAHCNSAEHGVVCDDLGLQHSNVCVLLARKRQLSYIGPCMTDCVHNSPVCGVNGETYMNECAALADSVLVDYHASCRAAPEPAANGACHHVTCDRHVPEWCEGFIPPGACCPVCGSQISSIYSTSYVDKIIIHSEIEYISTKDIADHLRHHLSSRLCNVYTYISFEKEIVALILLTNKNSTREEVEFCKVDAQRISNMMETKSPILNTDIKLSVLLTGSLHSSKTISILTSSCTNYTPTYGLLLMLYLIVILAVT